MSIKNTLKELKPREKESILAVIRNGIANNEEKKDIITKAEKKMVSIGLVEKGGAFDQMLSVCLALYTVEKAKAEGKKPIDLLPLYVAFKRACYNALDDFGAFGDVIETVCRIACKPSALVTFADLHVKRQNDVDITIRKTPFEIGTNGKTFLESTEDAPMDGKYKMISYGVFDKEEKESIFNLFITGQIEKGLTAVCSMMYVFDKDTFFECMTTKTGRAAMYQYKPSAGHWQVIYNGSKHTAFLKRTESENIPTLGEWLKK